MIEMARTHGGSWSANGTYRQQPYMIIWYQARRDNRRNFRLFRHVEGASRFSEAKRIYAARCERFAEGTALRVELVSALDLRLIEGCGDPNVEDEWVDSKM